MRVTILAHAFFAFLFLLALGCSPRTEWVASVGNQRISKQDAALRREMIKLLNPKITQKEATEQLISYKVQSFVLEAIEEKLSQHQIAAELDAIKKEAKRDPRMAAIVRGYERNPSFYELYVYPRIVEKKIKELYEADKSFHEKELVAATHLLNRAKAEPSKLEALCGEMGIPFFQGTFSEADKNIQWAQGRGLAAGGLSLPKEPWFADKIKNEILVKTGTGKIFSDVYPVWFGYLIFRRDPSEKNHSAFSVAVAPRKAQWLWLNQKSFLMPITRFDGAK